METFQKWLTRDQLIYCYAMRQANQPVHPSLGDPFNRMTNRQKRQVLGDMADDFEPLRAEPKFKVLGIPNRRLFLSVMGDNS